MPQERNHVLFIGDHGAYERLYGPLAERYELTGVSRADEALRSALEVPPDLLVCDAILPDLDGLQLLEKLRTHAAIRTVPIIFLSERAGEAALMEAIEAGADDCLTKPITARNLLAHIAVNLARARVQRRSLPPAERYRSIADASSMIFWSTNGDGSVAFESPSWQAFTGQSPEQYRDGGWLSAIHSDDRERVSSTWQEALSTRGYYQTEYRLRRHDNVFRYVVARAVPVVDRQDEGITEWIGTCADVDEQKRAQALLAGQKQAFELAVNGSELAVVLEVLVRTLEIQSDGRSRVAIRLLEPDGERFQHAAGAHLPKDCWSTPIVSSQGKVLGMFAVDLDNAREPNASEREVVNLLTHTAALVIEREREAADRQLAERALRESEEKFRDIADNMSQFAWTADSEGRRFWYNRRWYQYTGATVEQMMGHGWRSVYHPDHRERVIAHMQRCWKTGENWEDIFPLRGRDGQYRWFLSRAVPVRDASGRILRWFGTNTDITEQRKTEQDLRRANRDLEQFAYSASHDLQEPIRNIAIFSQILGKRYGDKLDPEGLRYLKFVTDGAHRMELLVKDLFAYTHSTVVSEEPLGMIDAKAALTKALSNLSEAIRESGAEIVQGLLPVIRMHEIHLQQLFQNLIGNAIKYRSEALPRIHVSAERLLGCWRFSVADNGIGIDSQYNDLIFGIFKRLHTQDRYPGTGIGLAICQRLVDRYGGQIAVQSEAGKGATFLFTVPDPIDGND